MISEDGGSEKEIGRRICIAKRAFGNIRKLLNNLSKNMEMRLRLIKCFVWSTLIYGCETWTIKINTKKKIEATDRKSVV